MCLYVEYNIYIYIIKNDSLMYIKYNIICNPVGGERCALNAKNLLSLGSVGTATVRLGVPTYASPNRTV